MNPHPKKKGWAWLGVLTWNTHMGRAMTPELWRAIRQMVPRLHVILLQEVSNPNVVRQILGEKWMLVPTFRADDGRGTTYIALRRSRFTSLAEWVKNVRYGSKHSRQVVSFDGIDKKTRRPTLVVSLHPDPLGKGFVNADKVARWRHERQVQAGADRVHQWQGEWSDHRPVVIVGGDLNEQLAAVIPSPFSHRTAMARLHQVGLRAAWTWRRQAHAHRVKLDDIWSKGQGISLIRRIQWRPKDVEGAEHLDHDLVFALYSVRKEGSW